MSKLAKVLCINSRNEIVQRPQINTVDRFGLWLICEQDLGRVPTIEEFQQWLNDNFFEDEDE